MNKYNDVNDFDALTQLDASLSLDFPTESWATSERSGLAETN